MPKKKPDNLKTQIINLFGKVPSISIKFNLISKKLNLNKSKKAELRNILKELIEEKIFSKNGKYYQLYQQSITYEGTIVLDKEQEYAVDLRTEFGFERIRIRKKNLLTALINDIVEVSIIEFPDRNIKEAIVKKIIKRAEHKIVGNFKYSSGKEGFAFVIPDNKKFRKDIYIPKKYINQARNGDKVVCEITNWEYQDLSPEGKIISVLGAAGDIKTEFKALIEKYGLTKTFPQRVRAEVTSLFMNGKKTIPQHELKKRLDLRDKTIFTIDPIDAKDFDDAVSIERNEKGNYVLGVHIADVGYYVAENTETDKEALKRGTSVYLMNDVVPMLPEKLSNDICSLREGVDRLTFSVFMEVNSKGDLLHYNISKSVIKSRKRFTYQEVQDIIDKKEVRFLYEIQQMNELHKILFKKRLREGSLDFEKPEVDIEIDNNGFIKNIKPKHRLESMRMIEDFMLLANKCVTLFIERKDPRPPFIYRVHDLPDKKRMKELSYFVRQFGINLNPESKESIQRMLQEIQGRPEEYLINDITIRSMAKALYSEKNIGHYGLGFKLYTHFTSPIRRYPDLIVHRILFDCLNGQNRKKMSHYKEILPEICEHSSDMEENAVRAEREAIKILQIEYMEKHLGDDFWGVISGITEYGLYIEITENLIEGMVRLKDLHDDYYILDEKNFQLIGRHRRKKYRIGDRVKVKVAKIDKEKRWIDFVIRN